MIVENRKIIKELNLDLFNQLNDLPSTLTVEDAKKGNQTFSVLHNEKPVYFHSKYTPLEEAKAFVEKSDMLEKPKHILFIGTGLGYHIIEMMERHPKTTFSIFEPNLSILKLFLEHVNLKKIKGTLAQIIINSTSIPNISLVADKDCAIVAWPKSELLYSDSIKAFYEVLQDELKKQRNDVGTNASFQGRWTTNVLRNYQDILSSPNILTDIDHEHFQGKPVILVAAGPSLNPELELIRKIINEKRAYVFSVGSAINALLAHDIVPHGVFSYDPKSRNSLVLKKFVESGITTVPIVFGTSIGREAIMEHVGPKVHFILSQDAVTPYLTNTPEAHIINDATSIAIVALRVLAKLGFSDIILVGQNLGFLENKRFADGIAYPHIKPVMDEQESKQSIDIESVDGSMMQTSTMYFDMKRQIEQTIAILQLKHVINTTRNGAKIAGTTFSFLEELLQNKLSATNIVDENWYNAPNQYNKADVYKAYLVFEEEYKQIVEQLNNSLRVIEKMEALYSTYLFQKIEPYYTQFDHACRTIFDSTFFKKIIQPMTLVQSKQFNHASSLVAAEKNPKLKYEKFQDSHVAYFRAVLAVTLGVREYFQEFSSAILEYKE